MKKMLFIIGGLAFIAVLILVGWDVFYKEEGILESMFNGGSEVFNGFFGGLFGSDAEFLPEYDPTDDGTDSMDITNPFD